MSTFYLLVDAGGVRLLVDAGGTYLAYQAGSTPGEGTTYTLTPTFDTSAFGLPDDIVVWYSQDNTTFTATGGFDGATRAGNVLTIPDLATTPTVYAALVYEDGTRVTDEDEATLASVSVTLGAIPTTIGNVTLNSPADITVGDPAVSYTATIDGTATDETYTWSVNPGTAGVDYNITNGSTANATIEFLTADDYIVTCTVTSASSSDSPASGTDSITVFSTLGTVTVSGSATPTEGLAESYSVAFDGSATDATYLWTTTDGSATIATPTSATTDITFSTDGSFDVTCTVSSVTASDSTQEDTLGVTVAAPASDWDTAATVVGRSYGSVNDGSDVDLSFYDGTMWSIVGQIINPIAPDEIARGGATQAGPWTSTSGGFNATTMGSVAPYAALWVSGSGWQVGPILTTGTFKTRVDYTFVGLPSPLSVPTAMVFYASDPGDPSGWRDYDGPTS